MFSLRSDLFFPTIALAKSAARRLNAGLRRQDPVLEPAELRELQRMREELRAAQERIRLQVTRGRLWF